MSKNFKAIVSKDSTKYGCKIFLQSLTLNHKLNLDHLCLMIIILDD